jgi:hypothetical protein
MSSNPTRFLPRRKSITLLLMLLCQLVAHPMGARAAGRRTGL